MAIKIFIDQGHNPVNPNAGAEAFGVREQDVNYDIGVRLATLLNANPNFEARLSRNSPTEQLGTSTLTSLQARTDMANSWGADYFISIHANASPNPNIRGSEAYVFSVNSPAYELANRILEFLHYMTLLPTLGVFERPSLFVLRNTNMPAVLVETGYLTNPIDNNLLVTDPQSFARGIYLGILSYFGLL
ncbi:MAG: N-acetylmuramoyl-L-alanine amidase [Clostridiales bacterium]|nr:N-acetylmuramoyl-L-alanine amidase [Clostridiales bacterium]